MKYKFSIHNHTKFSGDKFLENLTLEKILKRAFEKDLRILAITDTSKDRAFDYLTRNYKEFEREGYNIERVGNNLIIVENKNDGKILLFPRAIEIHEQNERIGGHILAVGQTKNLEEDIKKYTDEDLIKIIHDSGGVAIAAHPCATKYMIGGFGCKNLEKIIGKLDGVEVFNAQMSPPNLRGYNKEAKKFADKYKTGRIAGNDSHLGDVERTFMIVDEEVPKGPDKFREWLKNYVKKTKDEEFYNAHSHEEYEPLMLWLWWMRKPITKRLESYIKGGAKRIIKSS